MSEYVEERTMAVYLALGAKYADNVEKLAEISSRIVRDEIRVSFTGSVADAVLEQYFSGYKTREADFINWNKYIKWAPLVAELVEIGRFELIEYHIYDEKTETTEERTAVVEYC